MAKKMLIFGEGYIGSNLKSRFSNVYETHIASRTKKVDHSSFYLCDIKNQEQIDILLRQVQPDVIIHTAAVNSLEKCNSNPSETFDINVQGTKNIVEAIVKNKLKTKFVFLSSDYVFNGIKGNNKESTKPDPQTLYGKYKYQSENIIKKFLKDYIIIRTANVFGRGGNFYNFILNSLNENRKIEVYADTYFTPTYINYLLEAIVVLLENNYKGIIHIAGKEKISRFDFALKLATIHGKSELISKAYRPKESLIAADSSLNTGYSQKILNIANPSIEKAFYCCLNYMITPYSYFKDKRGVFIGILQSNNLKEFNYVESKTGTIRGNHYHKKTDEYFFIVNGKIKVITQLRSSTIKSEMIVEKGDILHIPPNTIHTFQILKKAKWINILSIPMQGVGKDIYKDSL